MAKSKTQIIKNATFYWAKLDTPVDAFGNGKAWEIQARTEDKTVAEEWMAQQQNVKHNAEEGYFYINLKRYAQSADGNKAYGEPSVVDANKEMLSREDVAQLGNGSTGNIKVFTYEWSRGGRSGVTSQFTAVQVIEYRRYEESAELDF